MQTSSKKIFFLVATSLLISSTVQQCTVGPDCAVCTGAVCTECQNPFIQKVDQTTNACNVCPG